VATKKINVPDIGEVVIFRKKGLKNIRLRIDHNNAIKLSLPWFVPLSAGLLFVKSKASWLETQRQVPTVFCDGMFFGRGQQLRIVSSTSLRPSSSVNEETLTIKLPHGDDSVQMHRRYIETAIIRAIQQKADEILIPRTHRLASLHNLNFKSISTRKLKSRWGSCDQEKNITLNIYLVQVPEHLIDYVIAHELCHTKHLNHGQHFWHTMKQLYPLYPDARKELKTHKAVIATHPTLYV